jgi:hypothetical protein
MEFLSLKCYIADDGSDVVRTWWDAQSSPLRSAFAVAIGQVEDIPRNRLPRDLFKPGEKRKASDCQGLHQIRFDGKHENGTKFCVRVLGFLGPGRNEFTMLFPFDKELDDQYEAPCKTAKERMADVKADWTRAIDCTIAGEEEG